MARSNKACPLNTHLATWVANVCPATHTEFTSLPIENKVELANKISLRLLPFVVFLRWAMNGVSVNKWAISVTVWLCVVSQQGRVRRDFWEKRGGGRALGPAKLTETAATSASVCVTASVVSAVWLQVTICMHVCPQLSLWMLLWVQLLKVFVCIHSCANIHLCVFFPGKQIKSLGHAQNLDS